MATMNPLELYHDPALDDLIQQSNHQYRETSARQRTSRPERRSISDSNGRNLVARMPPSSALPPGPPISYRNIGQNADPALHRSFSQRAKGRPFAEEAFLDDDIAEAQARNRNRQNRRSVSVDYGVHDVQQIPRSMEPHMQRASYQQPQDHASDLLTQRVMSQKQYKVNKRGLQPAADLTSSAKPTPLSPDSEHYSDNPQSKWAHDRSPLQKLEVKLTDISKEEKRARMQEAEMKFLQNKKLGKAPIRPRQEQARPEGAELIKPTVKSSKEPATSRSRGPGGLGITQKPLHQNIPPSGVDSTRQPLSRTVDDRNVPQSIARKPVPASQSIRQQDTLGDENRRSTRTNSQITSDSDDQIQVGQLQVARAVSLQQQKPRTRQHVSERPITERERNASHQAALEQLTGNKSGSTRIKTRDPKRPITGDYSAAPESVNSDSSLVGVDLTSMAGGFPNAEPSSSQQKSTRNADVRQSQPPTTAPTVVQNPKALQSVDSPPASLIDVSKARQRKSSVSFREPFDRRRPVDEWKTAVTACLTLDDFSTDPVQPDAAQNDTSNMKTAWWEKSPAQNRKTSRSRASSTSAAANATATATAPISVKVDEQTAQFSPRLYVKCGPLLRYAGLRRFKSEDEPGAPQKEFWRGSIMIVTQDSQCSYEEFPTLRLFSHPKKLLPPPPTAMRQEEPLASEYVDPIAGLTKLSRTGKALYVRPVDHLDFERDVSQIENDEGIYEASPSPLDGNVDKDTTSATTNKRTLDQNGEQLGRFKEVKAFRLYADPDRDVTFWRFNIEIELGATQQHIGYRINKGAAMGFWVPAKGHSMNIMFHSCNGFSLAVNPNQFTGPDPLWRDVLNNHQTRPFHVMIGGGDQIYNDRVTVDTKWFAGWTKIKNPHHKHHAPFTHEMKEELETFYLERYSMWFSQGLFALANSSIPMINMWDDHDIIDGFGSYPHDFMVTPVFSGLGNIAYKYYMLFQHQSVDGITEKDEPSWLLGHAPGPYIQTKSRSIYCELGQSIAFLGIDCRTERTKHTVLSIDTCELILQRCRDEMIEGQTKHLLVVLGVPIAYPRLVWLENILTNRALDPIKALGRAGILKPGLLNKFDGGVEILDDLDDHWTARHHKEERNIFIEELQDLAAEKSARITILSGDVHLAAVGQFYSNPKLKIPKDKDHRYMPNIISSAIVNTPPPDLMADVLNKRNKVHHLNEYTDENMIPLFTHDVDHKRRNNSRLLPRRNWCSICEYVPGETPPPSPLSSSTSLADEHPTPSEHDEDWSVNQQPQRRLSISKADLNPRNLIRRLSSRNAPPSAYRTDPQRSRNQSRAASFEGVGPNSVRRSPSPQIRSASADGFEAKALRPTFHRRPTNFSEKAARKGIVPAVDADGNEIDVNDHINLESGLDIVLNCEVNQKDPLGMTLSYRLLVPALFYDGSSDREKISEPVKPGRRDTVLKKFGLRMRPNNGAQDQLDDSYEDDDISEPYSDQDDEPDKKLTRGFSLFGSRNKRRVPANQEHDDSSVSQAQPDSVDRQITSTLATQPPPPPSSKATPPTAKQQPYPPPSTSPQPQNSPSSAPDVSRSAHRRSRPGSYTIGTSGHIATQIPSPRPEEQFFASQPYDADAAYVQGNQASNARSPQLQHEQPTVPQRRLSKQERVLGIGAGDVNYQVPSQSRLRGNGILGKNLPPSSYHSDFDNVHRSSSVRSDSNSTKGYSRVEAYREPKGKRRWSLNIRDKARGFVETVEGRRRDRNEFYSDEDEEEFWEGPAQGYSQPNRNLQHSQSVGHGQGPGQGQGNRQTTRMY